MRRFPHRPSPALIVAVVAVVLAGAGSAVAARVITSKQIKNGTIQLKDLRKSTRAALAGGRGPQGAPGSPGSPGSPGAPGEAAAFAGVRGDGNLFTPASLQKNVGAPNVQRTAPGVYCFVGLPFTVQSAVATGANGFGANFTVATVEIQNRDGAGALGDCPADAQVRVRTVVVPSGGAYSPSVVADAAFYVWFED